MCILILIVLFLFCVYFKVDCSPRARKVLAPRVGLQYQRRKGGAVWRGGGVSQNLSKPKESIAFLTCHRRGLCAGHA